MKQSKLYTHLGIAGALLVPALAVAAVEIPNVFEGGDPVSASQMNENFEAMADAIDALEARVEKFENGGLQPPVALKTHTGPLSDVRNVYQVHTDGVMSARGMGEGLARLTVRFDLSSTETGALDCASNCIQSLGRGYDGGSGAVFVPAGHYVVARLDEIDLGGSATVFWQPLHGPDASGKEPTLID
ncbi:MAG TPA: hypothetical protein VI197_17965 [Polyangiaceae bacterium]